MCARYFAVTCKHGHRGVKRYEPITFAVVAKDALEACAFAKKMPGVKHSQTVIGCREISAYSYRQLRRVSAYERGMFK